MKRDFFGYAIRYAHTRAEWWFLEAEERRERDRARTISHNAFIDACNIMSRAMVKAGESAEWRTRLPADRKEIGDFACWIHAFLAVEMR